MSDGVHVVRSVVTSAAMAAPLLLLAQSSSRDLSGLAAAPRFADKAKRRDEALRREDPLPHVCRRYVGAVGHLVRPLSARTAATPRTARVRVSALQRVAPHVSIQAAALNDASTRARGSRKQALAKRPRGAAALAQSDSGTSRLVGQVGVRRASRA